MIETIALTAGALFTVLAIYAALETINRKNK